MSRNTTRLVRAAFSALQYSGAARLMAPFARGEGIIFTLHSVRPEPPAAFEPNRILKVSPSFLEETLEEVQSAGYDIVSLDEMADRLEAGPGARSRPFACFTLDDGYRDNRDYAYPIFKRFNAPFTIYVPTDYPDGKGDLWWLVLEAALKTADRLDVDLKGETKRYALGTSAEKQRAFHEIYWALRAGPEQELRSGVAAIARSAGYDASNLCRDLIMTWDEIRELAADPLVTIGAHTKTHRAVAKLSASEARAEIATSVTRIEAELGRPCRHFSFPYGDSESAGERDFALAKDLGLRTAVTTRKGVIQRQHAALLTGLPRVSLNGDYQSRHFVRLLMTGAPFTLLDGAKAARSALATARRSKSGYQAVPST